MQSRTEQPSLVVCPGNLNRLQHRKRHKELEKTWMSSYVGQQIRINSRFWRVFVAMLVLACALAAATQASAQKVTPPTTPTRITPPEGASAFLVGHARGTQGYVCLPTNDGGASWTILAARPEATLFAEVFRNEAQIITHFLSPDNTPNHVARPTWQSSFDSSKVWAARVDGIPAGSDPVSCPNDGAIDCLLLHVAAREEGSSGGKSLTRTSFIQRLNTKGGSAPAEGCSVPGDVGKQALVPYLADYFFFQGGE